MKLDKEEKELLKSYDKGEWKSIKDFEKQKAKYQRIAKNTSTKNKRINIRLTEKDLSNLKAKSLEEGMPYQTLIASIIHKFPENLRKCKYWSVGIMKCWNLLILF